MNEFFNHSFLSWVNGINLKVIFVLFIKLALIGLIAFIIDFVIRRTIIRFLNSMLSKSRYPLLQLFEEFHVFDSLALMIVGFFFILGSFTLDNDGSKLGIAVSLVVLKTANLFNLYILTVSINRMIFAVHEYYQRISSRDDKASWYSYIKIVSFISWLGAFILAIAYIFGRPPVAIVTGLGALSAVILLVFKDTFLGIVSSIQANASSTVRVGDLISISKYNIEGTVEDISINSVKIRNGDNTITSLPTYILTTEAITNLEHMHYVQARRFRYDILLDTESIVFINNESYTELIRLYPVLDRLLKQEQLNIKELTNLSLYRLFLVEYLKEHLRLNQKYTNLVKVLNAPVTGGISLQINAFTLDTSSSSHERVKAQIIEFAYANLHVFKLKAAV